MREVFAKYLEDELWLIKETHWVRSLQNIRESQFTLGNGYFATRGVLEEIPYDAMPGTYIAGVYDKLTAQVAEMVNLPNPVNFKFTINGEKLGVIAMDVISHKRVLNMKKGLLVRHTVYKDSKRRKYDYQSLRFVSMHNKNIGVMQIVLTPLDDDCEVDVSTGIDTSVTNSGVLTEGRKRHFRLKELGQFMDAGYLVVETLEKKHIISYWSGFYYEINGKRQFAKDNIFKLELKKGQSVVFTKVFYMERFPSGTLMSKDREGTFKKFNTVFRGDISKFLQQHIKVWGRLWKRADVVIEGTANLQQNVRFNIYHMLICLHENDGFSSIGARTLSGEGYRGHIFWDTEVFMLPYYLFTFPGVAKNMLLYRYNRMDAARKMAQEFGYKGVMFPWESADTGEEETPGWAKDIDGSIVKIYTHKMEHHITADIAYAVYKYYVVTADESFMEDYGYEMIFETARFWASRVTYNSRCKVYEIKHVIGPDEFHIDVNNNAFTNMMAKWNLLIAYKLFSKLKKQKPNLAKKIQQKIALTVKEVKEWKKISAGISFRMRKDRVIEQFDGYFRLKRVFLRKTDENGIPIIPEKWKTEDASKTQLVKQADVVMLMHLLSDIFNIETKKVNYEFYIQRTVHKSSLSAPIHAVVASECGDMNRAYNLFNVSLRADISNLYGNTKEGIHAASLGGTWQALIHGFAGVTVKRERLCVNPRMPRSWSGMKFSLQWRGDTVQFELTNNRVKIKVSSRRRNRMEVEIFGHPCILKTNKKYTFQRRKEAIEALYYY